MLCLSQGSQLLDCVTIFTADLFSNNDLESSRAGQRGQDIRQILPRELLDSGVCVYENSIITEGKTFAYHGLPW